MKRVLVCPLHVYTQVFIKQLHLGINDIRYQENMSCENLLTLQNVILNKR